MNFDFSTVVGSFSPEEKIVFYTSFANRLTIANRVVWSNKEINLADQVEQLKWLNEIMHRVLNRLLAHQQGDVRDDEENTWNMIKHHVSQSPAIGGYVSLAINESYAWVLQLGSSK